MLPHSAGARLGAREAAALQPHVLQPQRRKPPRRSAQGFDTAACTPRAGNSDGLRFLPRAFRADEALHGARRRRRQGEEEKVRRASAAGTGLRIRPRDRAAE
jgi:hypothetical protein